MQGMMDAAATSIKVMRLWRITVQHLITVHHHDCHTQLIANVVSDVHLAIYMQRTLFTCTKALCCVARSLDASRGRSLVNRVLTTDMLA
jgi:hypothetical protein